MIGSWVVANNVIIKVLEVKHDIEDSLVIQFNDSKPHERVIHTDEEGRQYIKVYYTRYYLDECFREV